MWLIKKIVSREEHWISNSYLLTYLIGHNNPINGFRPAATHPSRRFCFLCAYASWLHQSMTGPPCAVHSPWRSWRGRMIRGRLVWYLARYQKVRRGLILTWRSCGNCSTLILHSLISFAGIPSSDIAAKTRSL